MENATRVDASPLKDSEIGQIPVDWNAARLMDVMAFSRKPRGLDISGYDFIPFIPMDLIPDDGMSIKDYVARKPSEIKSGTYCECGDILLAKITPSFENGKQAIVGGIPLDFAYATTEVYPLKGRPDRVQQMFLFYLLKSPAVRADLAGKMEGSTGRQRVPKAVIENYSIPLPPLPEQRRIAQVLTTIQRAIGAQEKVVAAGKELKRSLMQRLFTCGPGAEPVPTKETEIGEMPEHWQVAPLGELAHVKGGKRLPKGHRFSTVRTPYPYVRVVDFASNSVETANLRYLTPDDHERLQRYTISSRDVYISIAGTIGLVGTVPEGLDGANLTENAAKLVVRDEGCVISRFLAYALASQRGQAEIDKRATKTSQPKLALTRIRQIPIPLPSGAEQRQIAHVLSAADRRIEAEQARKVALEELFKSMLHQLLTGQLRVTDLEV